MGPPLTPSHFPPYFPLQPQPIMSPFGPASHPPSFFPMGVPMNPWCVGMPVQGFRGFPVPPVNSVPTHERQAHPARFSGAGNPAQAQSDCPSFYDLHRPQPISMPDSNCNSQLCEESARDRSDTANSTTWSLPTPSLSATPPDSVGSPATLLESSSDSQLPLGEAREAVMSPDANSGSKLRRGCHFVISWVSLTDQHHL